jgi:DNA-binding CsgD family transcriptional regulator
MEQVDRIFAALIGDIYDASLDRALWPRVFESICSYVGGTGAPPDLQDKVRRFVDLHFSWGIEDDYLKLYSNDCLVNDDMRRRFEVILPHVRRALLISKLIDLPKTEAAAFADMLDGLSAGLFLVSANGAIVHANASGRSLVRDRRCLLSRGGQPWDCRPSGESLVARNICGGGARRCFARREGNCGAARSQDGERYVAHVLPLTAGTRRKTGTPYAAVGAVFVRKAELDLQSPFEAIAQDFRLTPGELRVLFGIVDIGGVPQVASVLGISETTVKTHLQRLFEKTTTSRQADLVKLVAGYSNPLAVQLGAKPQPGDRVVTTARF